MSSRDRTAELQGIARSLQSRSGIQPHAQVAPQKSGASEFTRIAKSIQKDINNTFGKLEKLTLLATKKSMFDDRPVEIQELTYIIKQDIANLNNQISRLQQYQLGKTRGMAQTQHNSNSVVVILQSRLANMSSGFKTVLEDRTKTIQQQQQRRQQFSGSAAPPENFMAIPPPSEQQQQKTQAGHYGKDHLRQRQGGEEYAGASVAIDMGGPSSHQASYQQMQLTENQGSAYMQDRSNAVDSINKTIAELGGIFTQLATLVHEQGQMTERIDANTVDTEMNIEGAHGELLNRIFTYRIVYFLYHRAEISLSSSLMSSSSAQDETIKTEEEEASGLAIATENRIEEETTESTSESNMNTETCTSSLPSCNVKNEVTLELREWGGGETNNAALILYVESLRKHALDVENLLSVSQFEVQALREQNDSLSLALARSQTEKTNVGEKSIEPGLLNCAVDTGSERDDGGARKSNQLGPEHQHNEALITEDTAVQNESPHSLAAVLSMSTDDNVVIGTCGVTGRDADLSPTATFQFDGDIYDDVSKANCVSTGVGEIESVERPLSSNSLNISSDGYPSTPPTPTVNPRARRLERELTSLRKIYKNVLERCHDYEKEIHSLREVQTQINSFTENPNTHHDVDVDISINEDSIDGVNKSMVRNLDKRVMADDGIVVRDDENIFQIVNKVDDNDDLTLVEVQSAEKEGTCSRLNEANNEHTQMQGRETDRERQVVDDPAVHEDHDETSIEKLKKKIEHLRVELDEAVNMNENLQQKLMVESEQTTVALLERDEKKETWASKCEDMEREIVMLKERVCMMDSEEETLQQQANEEQERASALSMKVRELVQLGVELRRGSDEREAEAEILKQRLATLEIELSESVVANMELVERLSSVTRDLASHSPTGRQWVKDELAQSCVECGGVFSLTKRKHHCRYCGKIFCFDCSQHRRCLPGGRTMVRVCNACNENLGSSNA
eukprot:CFRG6576T1